MMCKLYSNWNALNLKNLLTLYIAKTGHIPRLLSQVNCTLGANVRFIGGWRISEANEQPESEVEVP